MTFSFKGIDLKDIIQPENDSLGDYYVYNTNTQIYGKTTIYNNSKPLKTDFMLNNIDLLSNVEARYDVPESDVIIPTGVKGVRYVLRGGGGGGGGGAGGARSNWAGDAWTNGGSGGKGGNGEYIYGQTNVSGSKITISIGNGGGAGNGGGSEENNYHSASSGGGGNSGDGKATTIKIGNAPESIIARGGQGGGPAPGVNAGRNDAGGSDGSAGASRTTYDNNSSGSWDNTHVKNNGNGGNGGSGGSGGGNNGNANDGGPGNPGVKGGVQIIWLYG